MTSGNFTFTLNKKDVECLKQIVREVGEVDGNKAVMNSLSRGMSLITRQGKTNLSASNKTKTGNLKRSIRKKQVKKWKSVYGGFRKGKDGGNHAHLVDRGTDKRFTLNDYTDKLGRFYRKGQKRGSVSKDNPNTGTLFWTRAVESKGPQAMEKTMNVIYKELDKITRKKY